MTLRELKQEAEVPALGAKTPSAYELLKSGKAIARKRLDGDAEITAYANGYAVYSIGRSVTSFPIHSCRSYQYHRGGECPCISEELFEKEEWYLRLVLEGEDRISRNGASRERKNTVPYNAALRTKSRSAEIENTVLKDIIQKETLAELLKGLTDKQRLVVCRHVLEQKTQRQIARECGISAMAVSKIFSRAVRKMSEAL